MRVHDDASRKFLWRTGISVMNLREVDPLGWPSSAALLGQVPRVVIKHRCKVEDDKHEAAERYLGT